MIYNDENYELLLPHGPVARFGTVGCLPRTTLCGSRQAEAMGLVRIPDDLEPVPEADWKEVIAECHREKIFPMYHRRASKLQQKPTQNGLNYCVTEDSEVLTPTGWTPFPDYDWKSPVATVNCLTHAMEFQRPFEKHVYEYDGPMIYSTNRRIDFGVTPDHQMYVRKFDDKKRTLSNQYSFVRAGDLGWYVGLLAAPSGQIGTDLVELEVPGDRCYDGDDFLAMLGLIVSDGYAGGSKNTHNWVSFASFREDTRPVVEALAARVGFHECPSRRGVWVRYDAGALAAWLRENAYVGGQTGAKAKRVPDIVKCASVRQIKHFLHWFDDRNRDGSMFFSVSKRLIDDLQELHLRIGVRSTLSTRPGGTTSCNGQLIRSGKIYWLVVATSDNLSLDKKKHIETDHYKGMVYCAGVPNHTLLTRRNGSVLISSNCWSWGLKAAMENARLLEHQPEVDLAAVSIGWTVNWRNAGNYLESALNAVRTRGMCSSEFVPNQHILNPERFKAGWEEDALKYRLQEAWDGDRSAGVKSTIGQALAILKTGRTLYVAHNWWGHALTVEGMEWDETQTNNIVWDHFNSHADGSIQLAGQKGVPDEFYGIRSTSLS